MSRIVQAFERAFKEGGSRTALVTRSGRQVIRHSFLEMQQDVRRMQGILRAHGVRPGTRLLAFAPASYDLAVCMIAALQLGAPIMYVDIWAKQERLRRIFAQYRPGGVLVSGRTGLLLPFFREIGRIRRVIHIDRCAGQTPSAVPLPEIPESAAALLTMTTGSTGSPKIALRSHADLLHQFRLIFENLRHDQRETVLTTSFMYVFSNILYGFTTVLPMLHLGRSSDSRLAHQLALFRHEPVTMLLTSPDFCLRTAPVFPTLRRIYCGGAILNLHEAQIIRKKYPRSDCTLIYGSTECSVIASVDLNVFIRTLSEKHRALLGKPVSGVRVRLNDEGEILVASTALLAHYLGQDSGKEQDSQGTLWHHTADMAAYMDGMLVFMGKKGRTVPLRGRQICTNVIEQQLICRFPSIPKCAVLMLNHRIHVCFERPCPPKKVLTAYLSSLGLSAPILHTINKIPCDVKHHTKIDYERLKRKLI